MRRDNHDPTKNSVFVQQVAEAMGSFKERIMKKLESLEILEKKLAEINGKMES